MDINTKDQLTLFLQDGLASPGALPDADSDQEMIATSGRKFIELFDKSSPVGLLARTSLGWSGWASTLRCLTWKMKATPHKRLILELSQLTRTTSAKESSSFPTKMWPTPRASEYKDCGPVGSKSHKHMDGRDYLCAKAKDADRPSAKLNPAWVEWLMGFPDGWTNLSEPRE